MKPTTVRETLVAARALIEKGWCQGVYARDSSGLTTKVWGDQAVSFCAIGALFCVMDFMRGPDKDRVLIVCQRLLDSVCPALSNIVEFNDAAGRSKEDVLAVYDNAIQSLKESK